MLERRVRTHQRCGSSGAPAVNRDDTEFLAKLLENRELMQSPVSEVMDRALPVVNEDVGVETAVKYLKGSPALLVEEYGRIVGIVTRQDVLDIQG